MRKSIFITILLTSVLCSCIKIETIPETKSPQWRTTRYMVPEEKTETPEVGVVIVNETQSLTLTIDSLHILIQGKLLTLDLKDRIIVPYGSSMYVKAHARQCLQHPVLDRTSGLFSQDEVSAVSVCDIDFITESNECIPLWRGIYGGRTEYLYAESRFIEEDETPVLEIMFTENPDWFYLDGNNRFQRVINEILLSPGIDEYQPENEKS